MASLSSLLIGAYFLSVAAALNAKLVGTWTTTSAKVFTGPGFYNPVNDTFIEPTHTGISYSFTADGHYEEAYYRAISNPITPSCPEAILQFQHGTVMENADGSLFLTPFSDDGRQLRSNPCSVTKTSIYSRYNQPETISKYTVSTDAYKNVKRIDLYGFDGTPMNPMFLAYSPPKMLPTITMNPTQLSTTSSASSTSTAGAAKSASTTKAAKQRRIFDGVEYELPLNRDVRHGVLGADEGQRERWWNEADADALWWVGVGMTVLGGVAYLL